MAYKAYHISYIDIAIGATIFPKTYDKFGGKKAVIEDSLERVRVKEYSNYNTRLHCVFLAPTEESALEWCRNKNIMHWRNEQKEVPFYLYSVEIPERPIWFDSDILINFYVQTNDEDAISKTYWDSGVADVAPNTARPLEYMTANEVVVIGKTKWIIKTDGKLVKDTQYSKS